MIQIECGFASLSADIGLRVIRIEYLVLLLMMKSLFLIGTYQRECRCPRDKIHHKFSFLGVVVVKGGWMRRIEWDRIKQNIG